MRITFPLASVLALSIILAGCVSTQKRYERGVRYENEGRYAQAVEEYGKVLHKEPGWADARARLLDAGKRAIDQLMTEAHAAELSEDYDAAVRALDEIDRLRAIARDVDIDLPVPKDYGDYRQAVRTRALSSLLEQGRQEEIAGNWPRALDLYAQAKRKFRLSPAQAAEMDRRRAEIHLAWGHEAMDQGRFREALEHAEQALGYPGGDDAAARALRETALDAGTVRVVFIPFWRTDAWQRTAPAEMRSEFNDLLTYEHWTDPPLFVAMASPADVHRELRYRHLDRGAIDHHQAADVGRALDADLVITGEMVTFTRGESHRKENVHSARTRGRNAQDTTYVVEQFDLTFSAEIEYRIIDTRTDRILDERTVRGAITDGFSRGRYAGDYADLDLPRSTRRLFEPDEWEDAEHMLMDRLADQLADRLAERVYDNLLRQIN